MILELLIKYIATKEVVPRSETVVDCYEVGEWIILARKLCVVKVATLDFYLLAIFRIEDQLVTLRLDESKLGVENGVVRTF